MNRDALKELLKREAEEKKKEARLDLINPLAKYSTNQLKDELKRRKGGVE